MPLKKVVPELSFILEDYMWRWLLSVLKSKLPRKARAAVYMYVSTKFNFNAKQSILSVALSMHKYKLDMASKIMLIDVLGDVNTNSIDLTKGGFIFVEEVFNLFHVLSRNQYKRVRTLGIDCKVIHSDTNYVLDVNNMFYRQLKLMDCLTHVTMRGIADTEMLFILGSCCPQLEYLDIENSFLVSDTSVAQFIFNDDIINGTTTHSEPTPREEKSNCCCDSLTFFGIIGTEVTQAAIILALLHMPNLASFGGYISYGCVVKAILGVKTLGVTELALTHLWANSVQNEDSKVLAELCPNIEFMATNYRSLAAVEAFSDLASLTVECDFKDCEDEVTDCLSLYGSSLTNLTLIESALTELDAIYISELAYNLHSLSASLYLSESKPCINWPTLVKANIQISNAQCFERVVIGCPNLKKLVVTFKQRPYEVDASAISDALIRKVLSNGALKHLEHLTINECGLGIKGLEAILQFCSKLKFIATLYYWRGLTEADVRSTFQKIKMLNWELRVVVRHEHCDIPY